MKNKKIRYSPSVEHHIKQCEIAGCLHPPVYPNNVLGWCKLCREYADACTYVQRKKAD